MIADVEPVGRRSDAKLGNSTVLVSHLQVESDQRPAVLGGGLQRPPVETLGRGRQTGIGTPADPLLLATQSGQSDRDRPRSDCLDDEKRPEVGGGELPAKRRASVAEPERDGAGLDRRRDGGQDLRPQLFEVDLVA